MIITKNITNEKKDLINAVNSTMGFKDILGTPTTIVGAIIYKKDEVDTKTGLPVEKTVASIKTAAGDFVSTTSPTVLQSLEMILESYEPEEVFAGIEIIVKSKKSNGGREFLFIELA